MYVKMGVLRKLCREATFTHPSTTAPVMISSIQRTSEVLLTINCASTGKPATAVTWSKGSTAIVNDGTYQMSQSISDRRTSSYSNKLTIGGAVEDASGFYRCTVSTELHNTAPNTSVETGMSQLCFERQFFFFLNGQLRIR